MSTVVARRPLVGVPVASGARWLRMTLACLGLVITLQAMAPPSADAMQWRWKWYGGDALLNRRETNNLMFGSGAATAVGSLIPHPVGRAVAQATFGSYTAYANWVYNRRGCVMFSINVIWRRVSPGHYYGWPCV